ncbi:MAG: hypothetical protein K9K82_13845 [Desulfobacteraceae bacterium]|nr:hypothetical protein [Desulfobacteraceae bacterium]MCF8050308.1 hypothetical protein [Desulfobacterales bacterium]MCF8080432.1 hypothetical protein [Desulfobacterales bacterium]
MPYRTTDNRIDGCVITFSSIEEQGWFPQTTGLNGRSALEYCGVSAVWAAKAKKETAGWNVYFH